MVRNGGFAYFLLLLLRRSRLLALGPTLAFCERLPGAARLADASVLANGSAFETFAEKYVKDPRNINFGPISFIWVFSMFSSNIV